MIAEERATHTKTMITKAMLEDAKSRPFGWLKLLLKTGYDPELKWDWEPWVRQDWDVILFGARCGAAEVRCEVIFREIVTDELWADKALSKLHAAMVEKEKNNEAPAPH